MSDNFGTNQSRVLDATNRSFDMLIYQYKKPPLSSEVNLTGSVFNEKSKDLINFMCPSGWAAVGTIRENLSESLCNVGDLYTSSAYPANTIKFMATERGILSNSLFAWVNGWKLLIQGSGTTTVDNIITLNAPPTSGNRVDFVFLEVWKKLVGTTDTIYRYGNMLYGGTNFTNDLIDPAIGIETSLRIQIQYRIRVVNSIDIRTYPDGFDPAYVFAQGPLASPITCSGGCFTAVPGDPGLWRAGVGDSASQAQLQTVDGYTYAIPMFAVARRSSAAFNVETDFNGAGMSLANYLTGYASDRPDNLYNNWIVPQDILDLRHVVNPVENYKEIAQAGFEKIISGKSRSVMGFSNLGQDHFGTVVMQADAITPTDEGWSDTIAVGDGLRRSFSNAQVDQTCTLASRTISDKVAPSTVGPWTLWDHIQVPLTNYPTGSYVTGINQVYYTSPAGSATVFSGSQYDTTNLGTPNTSLTVGIRSGAPAIGGSGNITVDYNLQLAAGPNGFGFVPDSILEVRQSDATPSIAIAGNDIRLRGADPVFTNDGTHFDMLSNKRANYNEPYNFGHQLIYHLRGNGTESFTVPHNILGHDIAGVVSVYVAGSYRTPSAITRDAAQYYVDMGSPFISIGDDVQVTLYTNTKFFEVNRQGRGVVDTYEMMELSTTGTGATSYTLDSTNKPIIALASSRSLAGRCTAYVNGALTLLSNYNTEFPKDTTRSRITITFPSTATGTIEVPVLVKSAIEATDHYAFFYNYTPYQGLMDSTEVGMAVAEGPALTSTAGSGRVSNYTYTDGQVSFNGVNVDGTGTKWVGNVKAGDIITSSLVSNRQYVINTVYSDTQLILNASASSTPTATSSYTITALDRPAYSHANVFDRLPMIDSGCDASGCGEYISTRTSEGFPNIETVVKSRVQDILGLPTHDVIYGVSNADRGRSRVYLTDTTNAIGHGNLGLKFEKLDVDGTYQKSYQTYVFNQGNEGRLYLMVVGSETNNDSTNRFLSERSDRDTVDIFELPGRPLTMRKSV